MSNVTVNLCEAQLLSKAAPAHWLPLARALAAFDAARRQGVSAAELRRQHAGLLALAGELLEPAALADLSLAQLDAGFVTACLLLPRFAAATTYGRPLLDTCGSATLAAYRPDWQGDASDAQRLRGWCVGLIGEAAVQACEARIEVALQDGQRKAAVVAALCRLHGLDQGVPPAAAPAELFGRLYGEVGLPAAEITIIVSGCLIFFCLPFDGKNYTGAVVEPARRESIEGFLRRVDSFQQSQFAHFPVFGFLHGCDIDAQFIALLQRDTGFDEALLREELCHTVAILPAAKVDQYIVHDVWGHGWQLAALDFEHMYRALADYAEALDLDEAAASRAGGGLRLRDCLGQDASGAWQLDQQAAIRFFDGEVAERLPVALSAVLAEMLADISEYKFLHDRPDLDEAMPSSSAFKDWPTKWDLGVEDARFYYAQATKVFRWGLAPGNRRQMALGQQLRGLMSAVEAEAILAQLWDVWQQRWQQCWADAILLDGDQGQCIGAFGRAILALFGTHQALSACVRQLPELSTAGTPFAGVTELLLLSAAAFFEQDRAANLWRIDEFLHGHFLQRCRQLLAEWPATAAARSTLE